MKKQDVKKRLSYLGILGKVVFAVIWAMAFAWVLMLSFVAVFMTGTIAGFLFSVFLPNAYLVASYLAYKKFKRPRQTKKVRTKESEK